MRRSALVAGTASSGEKRESADRFRRCADGRGLRFETREWRHDHDGRGDGADEYHRRDGRDGPGSTHRERCFSTRHSGQS